jgi:ABC-2 type transport system ATP-binding protein
MSDFVIETHALTRYFGRRCVVDTLNLAVPRGSVFAFLGRNGSGKTTTIRMLLGFLPPTRGRSTLFGEDSQALSPQARARIGYLPEAHPVIPWMTVQQAEKFQAASFPHWNHRIFTSVIDHFSLSPNAKASHLSRGERAGLALALTLAPEPELLILDDPALGLDPVARRSLIEAMLYVTRSSDRTILFSSHILADVERVADHIAILDRSILRAQAPLDYFRDHLAQYLLHFSTTPPAVPALPGLLNSAQDQNDLTLTFANPSPALRSQLEALKPVSIETLPVNLEEALIGYMGDKARSQSLLQSIGGAA